MLRHHAGDTGKTPCGIYPPLFWGGEDSMTEAGAGHPCEAIPTCPAKGLLENKMTSSGAMKAS